MGGVEVDKEVGEDVNEKKVVLLKKVNRSKRVQGGSDKWDGACLEERGFEEVWEVGSGGRGRQIQTKREA